MAKGYPRTRFDIIDRSQIQEIAYEVIPNPSPVMMAAFTSDKGSEDWTLLTDFTAFNEAYGGFNFSKHGQAQLLVGEMLRNGSLVFGKRMVSDNATLANTTVKARVVPSGGVNYLYIYTSSAVDATTFDEVYTSGYGDYDPDAEIAADAVADFPLFTVTPFGRGASDLFFRIVPEYYASKSSEFIKYSFEVYEGAEIIESIAFTMNPDIVIENISQSLQRKIASNSKQVKVKVYEDGLYGLIKLLTRYATLDGERLSIAELSNIDFINGKNQRGTDVIGGIVTIADSVEDGTDLWTQNKPDDIEVPYSLDVATGIPLANGSYGTMGTSPIKNQEEYTTMLLGTYGADQESSLFDPVIYDLDANKIEAIFDCAYPVEVKNAIIDVVDFRGDCIFFADLGTTCNTLITICDMANTITPSRYVALYHNYFNVINPYTKKEITVTMPYLLAPKLIKHYLSGIGRPFAGIANNIYFPEIIEGSINFLPVVIPGLDQKQQLVDHNINYLSHYDGTPVMETMYTNTSEYTQLSYLHNVMAVQEIIKIIRTRCPRTRYTFLDGDDLENYITDVQAIINQYATFFKSITVQYMYDELYESNNIFYATLRVQFRNFIQEEYFKIIAIS